MIAVLFGVFFCVERPFQWTFVVLVTSKVMDVRWASCSLSFGIVAIDLRGTPVLLQLPESFQQTDMKLQ